jgi:hypothetical protein
LNGQDIGEELIDRRENREQARCESTGSRRDGKDCDAND